MKVRFQADADLNEDIVLGLVRREPTIDFQTASEAKVRGLLDPMVLVRAAQEARILVTHDRRTMPHHFAAFTNEQNSPGVLVIGQNLPIGVAIEELLLIWAASEADEWINLIVDLPL